MTVLIAGVEGMKLVLCGNNVFNVELASLPLLLSFKDVLFKSLQRVWSNNCNN